MKKTTLIFALGLTFVSLILSGCGSKKYSGYWYNYDAEERVVKMVEIEPLQKDGKYNICESSHYYSFDRGESPSDYMRIGRPTPQEDYYCDATWNWRSRKGEKIVATLNDKNDLEIPSWLGVIRIFITDDDKLNTPNKIYIRGKKEDLFTYKKKIRDSLQGYVPRGYFLPGQKRPSKYSLLVKNLKINDGDEKK